MVVLTYYVASYSSIFADWIWETIHVHTKIEIRFIT